MPDINTINEFNRQIELLQDNLNNVVRVLNDNMLKKLQDNVTEADNLVDSFQRGENITKKLGAKLDKLQKESNKNATIQLRLEKLIADAQRRGNKVLEDKLKTSQFQQRIYQKHIEQQQTFYNQLVAANREQQKQSDILGDVKNKYKEIAKTFTLASVFKILVDAGLRFSQVSSNIGKNLGYGADNANRVTSNLVKVAQSSTNTNVTLKSAAEAMEQISTATGYVAEYSADALQTQIMLTKQFQLTAEEAAGIYKFSLLTGKAASQVNKEMVGAFAATRNNLKAGIPFKATMAEAAKVSGVLASNLQNNPKRIVEAVTQAKALGTSLEQSAKQGEALLNFESSLENELKAELLTGKQLNLERARAAALVGDQVTVTQELAKNVGTIEEFDRMNVLQKKAIAEAVGLTADELARQLQNQKIALETGKSLAQVTEEELQKSQERQNTQERFNAALEKMQDMIGNIVAGPLGMMLEMFAKLLSNSISLGAILGGVVAVNLMKTINTLKQAKKLSYATAVTEIISSAFKSMGGLPVVGLALAGAAAGAGIAYLASQVSQADDIVSPGYGQRAIVSPEGTIALNNRDTIVAGTNLGGGGADLTPMINAINSVRASVDRLYTKDSTISMDGKTVGTTLTQNSYKLA